MGNGKYFILIFLFLLPVNAFSQVEFTIPEEVIVDGDNPIKLGDIAEFAGDYSDEFFSEIIIFKGLKPGEKKYLYKTHLESKLARLNLSDFFIYMERRVRITARAYEFSVNDGSGIIGEYLYENFSEDDYEIEKLILIGNRTFDDNNFDFIDIKFERFEPIAGFNRGFFDIFKNDEVTRVKFILKLKKNSNIVCASRDLKKGEILQVDDIVLVPKSFKMEKSGYFTEIGNLVGKKIRRNYRKGSIITSPMIFTPALISKGDSIQIVAVNAGLSIVTNGVAEKGGELGDMIPVLNSRSGKKLNGEIVSSDSVMVTF